METGQKERYREHCRAMIERFRDAPPADMGKAVIGAFWAPDTVDDWKALEDLVERSLQVSDRMLPYRLQARGMYCYRAGRFDEAIEWIPRGSDQVAKSAKGAATAALAMAYHQDGQTAKAIETLTEAEALLATGFDNLRAGGQLGEDWFDWLATRVLFREAVGLIRGQSGIDQLEAEN